MISIPDNNLPDSIREDTARFFEAGGTFARACAATAFPFEVRPQQQKMAAAVADSIIACEHLAVEAGTGVGKTFAYLVPLILSALEGSHPVPRVAVSTHTINLQEQIMFKDLPFLIENMGLDFKVALCKGRQNYLCRRRLESAGLMSGDLFNKGAEKEFARIRRWADHTSAGDLSDFSGDEAQPEMFVWRQVCSEHDNCLGKKCPYYARCFLMRARAEAFNADLLVLNHHLLFSDLALRQDGKGILPDFGALVLDEAHNIEDVAGEHLGLRVSQGGIQHWLRRLYAPASGKGLLLALKEFQIADETARVWEAVDHFFIELGNYFVIPDPRRPVAAAKYGSAERRPPLMSPRGQNSLADSEHRLGQAAEASGSDRTQDKSREACQASRMARDKSRETRDKFTLKGRLELKSMLAEQIGALTGRIGKLQETIEDEAVKAELKAIAARGDEIRQAIEFFRKDPDPNYVCWIESEGKRGKPREARGKLALVSAPIDVAPLLKELLFPAYAPIVMTSATLSVGGSLAYFRGRVGAESCRELIVDSPFNYARQMKVFIAADLPEPNDGKFPEAATGAVAHFVRQSRGRAFVLFTNAELMRQVAGQLRDPLAEDGFLVLVQGEGLPRHAMLERFRMANGHSGRQKASTDAQGAMADAEGRRQKEEGGWQKAGKIGRNDACEAAGLNDEEIQDQSTAAVLPKSKIENRKSKITNKAVLFGLDSFWMGVDVPGEALSNVIIVRLPFAVPDEPLIRARVERITASGADAFREYSLPQAILKFRQGVGRLIRTATDEGIIVILDSRIITRWYGKFFLKAIPECPVEQIHIP